MTRRAVATFNTGSSSLKFSLFGLDDGNRLGPCLLRGSVKDLGSDQSLELSTGENKDSLASALAGVHQPKNIMRALAGWMAAHDPNLVIAGAGHRIVHGGRQFGGAAQASEDVLQALDALSVFAPSHQPHNLAGVRALSEAWPETVQTLSFDTAFHRSVPHIAQLYALPRKLSEDGIIRYGFHGLSYAHLADVAPRVFGAAPHRRLLALHLGSGASGTAMLDGRSLATTMGLTALDGLPMATRCGDLDPGVVLHLIQDRGMSADETARLLYKQSGLLGVSGLSSDIRTLQDSDSPAAREAIELYCYRIAREAGSLVTAMGGLDAVIFTGGVGENAPEIRRRILDHFAWLGVSLDATANAENREIISAADSKICVARVEADEERIIAQECAALL